MNRNQLLFLVVVGAGAALLGVLTAPLMAPDPPPEAAPAAPAEAPPDAAPPAAPDGPQITRTTSIPKPERKARKAGGGRAPGATATAAGAPTPAAGGGAEGDGDTGAPFGAVDPDREFTPDEIQATVATFKGDIEDCLDDWGPQIDGFDGRIVLQADFSPDGVEDVRVADLDNVPLQLLGCFSTPVWEASWPQPDGKVTISYPFVVEMLDEPEDGAPEDQPAEPEAAEGVAE